MMKLAILQNSIGIGGRSKVLAEAIRTLSVPDTEIGLFTLSESDSLSEFINYYGLGKYNFSIYQYQGKASILPGTLYQQPILNWAVKEDIREYDLVFNSNNCLQFLPSGPEYIHYIHLPTPAIPLVNERYRSSLLRRIYALPIKGMNYLTNSETQEDTVITNSQFTAFHYEQVYDSPPDMIIYPPSIDSVSLESFSGEGVVSLGSFHQNKRQLFQIKVAEQLPDIEFAIIGRSASQEYYRQCVDYINNHNINNVTLREDASAEMIDKMLQESKMFLHSMQNEPFGISTVEALDSGCIPVTHDSGGQREIISDDSLRYSSKIECINIISHIERGEYKLDVEEIRTELENYTVSHFQTQLQKSVNHV
jgi:glycosyltransferase involved in cell wall biosynthesis